MGDTVVASTTSTTSSKSLLSASDQADLENALDRSVTGSDPLYADTDGDGLDDDRERQLGTDPSASDTDEDGIPDGVEVDIWDTDPTLHDVTPPNVTVNAVPIDESLATTAFRVVFEVSDPSGVSTVSVRLNGREMESRSLFGVQSEPVSVSFESQNFQVGFDGLLGEQVTIVATDEKGNAGQKIASLEQNIPSQIASSAFDLPDAVVDPVFSDTQYRIRTELLATTLQGLTSGVFAGIGIVGKEFLALTELLRNLEINLQEFINTIVRVIEEYSWLEALTVAKAATAEVFRSTYRQAAETLDRNTPYNQSERAKYETFQYGYRIGYAGFFVLSLFAPSSFIKLAKGTKIETFAKDLDTALSQRSRLYRGLKFANGKRKVVEKRAVSSLTRAAGKPVGLLVQGGKTIGSMVKLSRLQRQAGLGSIDLTRGEATLFRNYLLRGGDDSADELDDVGAKAQRTQEYRWAMHSKGANRRVRGIAVPAWRLFTRSQVEVRQRACEVRCRSRRVRDLLQPAE